MMTKNSEDNTNKKKLSPSIILGIVSLALIILSIVIMIVGTSMISKGKTIKLFGYSFSVVVTPSMVPTINVDDIIIIKDFDYDKLEVGDIIVYRNTEYNINVVHRIVSVNIDNTYTTKGDANATEDSFPITKDIYIGKVVKYGNILGIGKVLNHYRWAIIIVVALIFIYILNSELVSMIKKIKEKQQKELEEENAYNNLSYEERKELMRQELLKELETKTLENKEN